jgi:hypothetical protein
LLNPALVLLISVPVLFFYLGLAILTAFKPTLVWRDLTAHGGLLLLAAYLMSFGLAPTFAFVYWLRHRQAGFLRALGLAHLYAVYSYAWIVAGWWAAGRVVSRRSAWAKTARTSDVAAELTT